MNQPDRFLVTCGNFFFRYRNFIFPLVFLSLFFVSPPGRLLAPEIFGCTLVVLGQAFRLIVIGYAYIKRGGKEGHVFADQLVVKGFFAHCRNPMYVGNLMIVTGLCLAYQSRWAYFVIVPFFIFAYLSIVIAEETYLRKRFGLEYDEYVRRVNRFIPNFRGLGASLSEFHYDWKRALRKDYGNVAVAALMLLTIGIRRNFSPIFVFGFGVLILFYGWARFLKKTGRLASSN